MDHDQAIESRACERYLLGELPPVAREAFEEHYFSCPACAAELRAAADLVGAARVVLSASLAPARESWLRWLRPVVAVPAFASLLLLLVYENVVYLPQLNKAAAPRILDMHSLIAANTRGESLVFSVAPNEPFGLYVDVPADAAHTRYELRLEDPAGRPTALRAVSAEEAGRTQVVVINPGRQAGRYTVVVSGSPASGAPPEELGRLQFTVELRK